MSYYRKATSGCSLLASAAVNDFQLRLENGKLNAILKVELFRLEN
jgi:hypothetical protein